MNSSTNPIALWPLVAYFGAVLLVVSDSFSLSANIIGRGSNHRSRVRLRRRRHRPLPCRTVRNWFSALSDKAVVKSCLHKSIGWF